MTTTATRCTIEPGDLVERIDNFELDPRIVRAAGDGWITLDIFGQETPHLPASAYSIVRRHDEDAAVTR